MWDIFDDTMARLRTWGRPNPTPTETRLRRHGVCWCCTCHPTVKCARSDTWKFWGAVRLCTCCYPSHNCFNQGPILTPSPRGKSLARTAPRITSNVRKLFWRTPRLPWYSSWLPFTHNNRHYHPLYQPTVRAVPLHWPPLAPLSRPTRSPRLPPPKAPRQQPLGAENNLNRARPMEGTAAKPKRTADPGIDVTLATSYGESDGNLDYVESQKNLPARSNNTPNITGHIRKL